MKAAIISGGGAAGAYTVGLLHGKNADYDFISGTSTGALMAPLVLLGEYDRLKEAYTSVTNKSIYTHNPFNKKGHISLWSVLWRQLTGKTSLGDTTAMKTLIKKFYTVDDHDRLRFHNKEFVANVTESRNYPPAILSVSSKDVSYDDMVNAMWASSCVPVFMSQVYKDGFEYTDGGLLELFSLKPVLDKMFTEVDVYLHRRIAAPYDRGKTEDVFHNVMRTISILEMYSEIRCMEQLYSSGIQATVSHLPAEVSGNFLNFDKNTMNSWYNLGYNHKKQ